MQSRAFDAIKSFSLVTQYVKFGVVVLFYIILYSNIFKWK
jgi:hypothetical protein